MARSNRQITQLMCDAARAYRLGELTAPFVEFGNTKVWRDLVADADAVPACEGVGQGCVWPHPCEAS